MSPCLAIFFPLSKAVCAPSTMGNMPLHSGQNTISPTRATGMPIHVRVPEAVMTFPPCVVISPRRMISLPSMLCAIRLLAGSPAAVRRTGRGCRFNVSQGVLPCARCRPPQPVLPLRLAMHGLHSFPYFPGPALFLAVVHHIPRVEVHLAVAAVVQVVQYGQQAGLKGPVAKMYRGLD